jgi:NAD(P)H-hydrate epimerase
MIVVTAEQMREMDRLTIEKHGVPSLTLMERAGAAVVNFLRKRFAREARKGVLIVAGKGNNGGDGLVVARLLKRRRIPCAVALLAQPAELSSDLAHNLRAYRKLRGTVIDITPDRLELLSERIGKSGLIVDAILGTGIKSEVRGIFAEAIKRINASGRPVIAVDIASGLDADKGRPLGVAVQADATVALAFLKLGQVTYPGITHSGELVVADIGIDERAAVEVAPDTRLLDRETIRRLIPRRDPDTHKGTHGHLLMIAGSRGKTGAAILSSRAAMRSGAGLVTLAAPRSLNGILASALVEVMTEPLRDNAAEEIEPLGDDEWRRLLGRKNALLFGPGIGVTPSTQSMLRWLLKNLAMPWVIDADGLNNVVLEIERLRHAKVAPVLTPHPGEMARLSGKSTAEINGDRIGVARSFAREHGCHLVLKGARTVIATASGKIFINPTGNPGMASAGMGDVLAGILAALLGQGLSPEDAMKLGVYLHGFVADTLAETRGQIGMIASDIIEGLLAGLCTLAV